MLCRKNSLCKGPGAPQWGSFRDYREIWFEESSKMKVHRQVGTRTHRALDIRLRELGHSIRVVGSHRGL
jgi:hypothetical protein